MIVPPAANNTVGRHTHNRAVYSLDSDHQPYEAMRSSHVIIRHACFRRSSEEDCPAKAFKKGPLMVMKPAESPTFDLRNREHKGRAAPISRRRGTCAPSAGENCLSHPKRSKSQQHLLFVHHRPTLSQMWPEREAGPPFAFKISMLHVFCSSHGLAHFAALFIDPRAK
jgi:hypothetical protein